MNIREMGGTPEFLRAVSLADKGLGALGALAFGYITGAAAVDAYTAYQQGDSNKAETIVTHYLGSTLPAMAAGAASFSHALAILAPLSFAGPVGTAAAFLGAFAFSAAVAYSTEVGTSAMREKIRDLLSPATTTTNTGDPDAPVGTCYADGSISFIKYRDDGSSTVTTVSPNGSSTAVSFAEGGFETSMSATIANATTGGYSHIESDSITGNTTKSLFDTDGDLIGRSDFNAFLVPP